MDKESSAVELDLTQACDSTVKLYPQVIFSVWTENLFYHDGHQQILCILLFNFFLKNREIYRLLL